MLPDRFYAVGCFGGVSLCDAGRGLLAAAAVGAAGGGCLACWLPLHLGFWRLDNGQRAVADRGPARDDGAAPPATAGWPAAVEP